MRKILPKAHLYRGLWSAFGFTLLSLTVTIAPVPLRPTAAQAQSSQSSVAQGFSLLEQGRVNDAIATFERVLQQNPNNLDALQGLGIAYRRAGRDADALTTYQRILAIDLNNQLALSTLGLLGEFRSEWQPIGIQALTRLLELDPNSVDARAQRAKLYFYQGLFSQSLADYALVLPRTSDPDILRPAAEAYTFSGDYVTGLNLFERYWAVGGMIEGDTAIAFAQALRDSGQIARATQILELSLQNNPKFDTQQIRLRGALASTYAANRQFQSALDLIQPLRGRLDSRLTLGRALNAIGDYSGQISYNQEAASLYGEVLATSPSITPGTRREAISVLGNLPEQRVVALQLNQQLTQLLPEDASLILQGQILAYQTGSLSRADFVQQVRTAFPALPPDPVQVRFMAQTLSRLSPPLPELLPLYQSLIAAGTTEPFLNFRVAQIYAQQGQFAEARSALTVYAATPAGSRDPETVQLLLAEIERQEGNFAQSEQRYQAVLKSAQSPVVRTAATQGLATIYQAQGRWSEAIALYDLLIAQYPQEFAYQLGRTTIAYQAGAITEEDAEAVLQQGVQQYAGKTPPPELINLATALPPSANRANLYQQLLAFDPTNPRLQLRSLQVLAETDPAQAQAKIAQLIAQNPNSLDLYFVQGEIAQQSGDYDLARQSYAAIIQHQPSNLDALLALAGLEFQQGNYEEANNLYQQALSLNAQNSTARTSLAALNAVQGRPLAAIQQLRDWQSIQLSQGTVDPQVARQIQQISEGLLQQRGIQPYWERF
jgi:tetratricopeptide (TPR) repeat protein